MEGRRDRETSPTNPRNAVDTSRPARDDSIASTSRQSPTALEGQKKIPLIFVYKKQNYNINEERIDMQKKYIEEVNQINENKIENTEGEISTSKIQISDLSKQIEILDHQRQELFDAIEPLSGVSDKLSKMQLFDSQIQNNLKKIDNEVAFFNEHKYPALKITI